ncbi:MAG TPA: hypothetical protein VFV05_09475, partial [Methylomirabilota bacterium]|nr:hypothetical protein [Methylomirabilota bacterium]
MPPRQSVSFAFGPVDQATGKRHIQPGSLVEAINVRQVKRNELRKRRGYARTLPTFSGASWTGPAVDMVAGLNATKLIRDSDDRCWVFDPDTSTCTSRGRLKRVMPSWSAYLTGNAIEKPQVVEAGDNLWFFALISGAYYYAVVDKTTGI